MAVDGLPKRQRFDQSKRSSDERSDIRDWLPNVPHPHVAALMRATCLLHQETRHSHFCPLPAAFP